MADVKTDTVFDPTGQPVTVSEARAAVLAARQGWSRERPAKSPAPDRTPEPDSKPRRRKAAEDTAEDAEGNAPESK